MMTSYLAYLTDGVSHTVEEKTSGKAADATNKGVGGGISIPAGGLASVTFSGRFGRSHSSEDSIETKIERHHTAASLFNVLLDYLTDANLVGRVKKDALAALGPGELVRAHGRFIGNPLEDSLGMINQMVPYFQAMMPELTPDPAEGKRSGNPAKKAAATAAQSMEARQEREAAEAERAKTEMILYLTKQMYRDIEESPVADLLVEADDGLNIIVTATREFFTSQVAAQLKSTTADVIGKVTLVSPDKPVSLDRRTVFAMGGAEDRAQMFKDLPMPGESPGNVQVDPPVVQIMPLAIFI